MATESTMKRLGQALINPWKQIFKYKGRTTRFEFLTAAIFYSILFGIAISCSVLFENGILTGIMAILFIALVLPLIVRRFNDLGFTTKAIVLILVLEFLFAGLIATIFVVTLGAMLWMYSSAMALLIPFSIAIAFYIIIYVNIFYYLFGSDAFTIVHETKFMSFFFKKREAGVKIPHVKQEGFVSFGKSLKSAWQGMLTLSGRTTRSGFWFAIVFYTLAYEILNLLISAVAQQNIFTSLLSITVSTMYSLIAYTLVVRRFRDAGFKSGKLIGILIVRMVLLSIFAYTLITAILTFSGSRIIISVLAGVIDIVLLSLPSSFIKTTNKSSE